jgi:hypothetical protein
MAETTPDWGGKPPPSDDFTRLLAQAPRWAHPTLRAVEAEAADWTKQGRSTRDAILDILSGRSGNHRVRTLALRAALLGASRGMQERENGRETA